MMWTSAIERIVATLAVIGLLIESARAIALGPVPGPAKLRKDSSQNVDAFPKSFFDEYDGFVDADKHLYMELQLRDQALEDFQLVNETLAAVNREINATKLTILQTQKWKYFMLMNGRDLRDLGPLPRPLQFIKWLSKFQLYGMEQEPQILLAGFDAQEGAQERAPDRLSKLESARTDLRRKMEEKAKIVKKHCTGVESACDAVGRRNHMFETATAQNPSRLLHELNEERDELERKISKIGDELKTEGDVLECLEIADTYVDDAVSKLTKANKYSDFASYREAQKSREQARKQIVCAQQKFHEISGEAQVVIEEKSVQFAWARELATLLHPVDQKIERERLHSLQLREKAEVLLGELKTANHGSVVEYNSLGRQYEKVQGFIGIENERIFNALRKKAVSDKDT